MTQNDPNPAFKLFFEFEIAVPSSFLGRLVKRIQIIGPAGFLTNLQ